MPELQMDVAVANRFISSLSKSLQALCHGCMDFDSGIEIVGYINVNIDSGSKVDYVLNEKVLKSTTNSMTFVSNSFLAKKESPKQTRDGACSPISHLSAVSSYPSGAHPSSHYQRTPHSQPAGGPHKRSWTDDFRIAPKRHRMQNPQTGRQSFPDHNSQPYAQSFPSSSHVYSDPAFKQPQGPASANNTSSNLQVQINIKKEALETDNQNAADSEHSPFDQSGDDQAQDSSHNGTNKIKIKCDPDADQSDTGETYLADGSSTAANEKTEFKGTFLDPSSSDILPSDDGNRQQESDTTLPSFDENSETDCTDEHGLTDDANMSSSRTANLGDAEAGMSGDNEVASDAAVEYDQAAEEESYSQSAYEDAGEGGSDAGQLEVIEIDDEDEDVQAMFGETQSNIEQASVGRHKRKHRTRSGADSTGSSGQLPYPARHTPHTDEPAQGAAITTLSYSDKCPICHIHLSSANLYQRHMNECHKEDRMLPFTCDLCQHGFFSQSGLRYHQQTHGGQTYSCVICDAKLKHKSTVRRHMESAHLLKECRYCENYFKHGQEFTSHIISCTPNK